MPFLCVFFSVPTTLKTSPVLYGISFTLFTAVYLLPGLIFVSPLSLLLSIFGDWIMYVK